MLDTLSKTDLEKLQKDMSNYADGVAVAHAVGQVVRTMLAEEIAKRTGMESTAPPPADDTADEGAEKK